MKYHGLPRTFSSDQKSTWHILKSSLWPRHHTAQHQCLTSAKASVRSVQDRAALFLEEKVSSLANWFIHAGWDNEWDRSSLLTELDVPSAWSSWIGCPGIRDQNDGSLRTVPGNPNSRQQTWYRIGLPHCLLWNGWENPIAQTFQLGTSKRRV